MNTVESIAIKLDAIRIANVGPHKERGEKLWSKRRSFLSSFASFYVVLPADEWISVTKAGIAAGGTSGMGQKWCSDEVRAMADKGYLATRTQGNRQWVRPLNTAALIEWAKGDNLIHEGMDIETWESHGKSWVEYMREH